MYASRPIVDDSNESSGDKEIPNSSTKQEEPVGIRVMSPINEDLNGEDLVEWLELEEWNDNLDNDEEVVEFHQLYIPEDSPDPPIESANSTPRSPSPIYIGALTVSDDSEKEQTEQLHVLNEDISPRDRPKLPKEDTRLITQMVNVGGLQAYSLLDTGCTTGVVSNEFAGVTKMPTFQLNSPIAAELGMSGS